ncbi:MAG: hypothetical protein R3227_15620 [Reinekea sp.]|nr:hypothetical protein [Reinekea sp.]
MPSSRIHFSIDPDRNLITAVSEPTLDYVDFNLHLKELAQDPLFDGNQDGLYDFSAVEKISGDPGFWEQTADAINNLKDVSREPKVAIVTGGKRRLEGAFDGWKVMMSLSHVRYETFIDVEQANAWLVSE